MPRHVGTGEPGRGRGKSRENQESLVWECLSTHASVHLTFQFPHAPRELTTKQRRNRSSSSSSSRLKQKNTVANSMRATSQSCFQLPSQDTLAAFCFLHARHASSPHPTPSSYAHSAAPPATVAQFFSLFTVCALLLARNHRTIGGECLPLLLLLLLHFIKAAKLSVLSQSVEINKYPCRLIGPFTDLSKGIFKILTQMVFQILWKCCLEV